MNFSNNNQFCDTEIFEFNRILFDNNIGYSVQPSYTNNNSSVELKIIPSYENNFESIHKSLIINYTYVFSIYEDAYDLFNTIFEYFHSLPIETNAFIQCDSNNIKKSEKRKIEILNVSVEKEINKHKVDNINYVRFDIKIEGLISDIFGYYTIIKRSLVCLNKYWAIDNNKVMPLFKFNKYDIASAFGSEIIVDDFYFDKYDNDIVYSVRYIRQYNLGYIEYSNPFTIAQKNIVPSRNEILSSILN